MLDTSVLVAAIRSRRGASFQVLALVGSGAFDIAVSVPLVFEYEDALLRSLSASHLDEEDVQAIVDWICRVAVRQQIFYLWRPLVSDPKDDMVAELALAARCEAIVTHNVRDFRPIEHLGVRVLTPGDFLSELKGTPE